MEEIAGASVRPSSRQCHPLWGARQPALVTCIRNRYINRTRLPPANARVRSFFPPPPPPSPPMAPYFLRNLLPRREQRAEGRPLLEALASITWVQWGHFWSGYVVLGSRRAAPYSPDRSLRPLGVVLYAPTTTAGSRGLATPSTSSPSLSAYLTSKSNLAEALMTSCAPPISSHRRCPNLTPPDRRPLSH